VEVLVSSYRSYPLDLKSEVASSGLTILFPKLRIPRTTAAYWIAKRRKIAEEANLNSFHLQRIAELELAISRERSLRTMVEEVRKLFPYAFAERVVKSQSTRQQLVKLIVACAELNPLKTCLETLGLTPRIYYRWVTAGRRCEISNGSCVRRHPNQLTDAELKTMQHYLQFKDYAHIPIHSLSLLAQRNGDLHCSVDTWYKYKKMYDWKRPRTKWRAQRKEKGLRATAANQLWHVDVTHIKLGNGKTVYLQTVIDNFSRFVVSWKLTQKISAVNTVKCLDQAKFNVTTDLRSVPPTIMMDGGPENNNKLVGAFVEIEHSKRVIARADISFSNSMVEAFFRSLKHNYLLHENYPTKRALERKLKFYFKEHNEVIPHSALSGGTPREVFRGTWNKEEVIKLRAEVKAAIEARRGSVPKSHCKVCI
jgi:putative transposase